MMITRSGSVRVVVGVMVRCGSVRASMMARCDGESECEGECDGEWECEGEYDGECDGEVWECEGEYDGEV